MDFDFIFYLVFVAFLTLTFLFLSALATLIEWLIGKVIRRVHKKAMKDGKEDG